MPERYAVGQAWTYEAPHGFEHSRIVIGAILTFASHEPVICALVTGAPMLNATGELEPLTIPFLPFSKTAFDATVIEPAGDVEVPASFADSYRRWKTDERGLGFINVPFKRLLRNMVEDLAAERQKVAQIACIKDH